MEGSGERQASVLFHQGHYREALRLYTRAYIDVATRGDAGVRVNILLNRSACHLKLKDFNKVLEDCNLVLDFEPANPKALSRKTKVLCSLGRFQDAYDLVKVWQKRDPLNDQAQRERQRLEIIVGALNDQDAEVGLESPPMGCQERVPPEGQEATPALPTSLQATRTASGLLGTTTGSVLANTGPAGLIATTTASGSLGTTTGSLLANTAPAGLLANTTASGLWGTTTGSLLPNTAPAGLLATTTASALWGTTTGSLLPNTAPAGLLATTTASGLWGTTTGSLLPNTAPAGLLATTTASGLWGTTTGSLLPNTAPAGLAPTTASGLWGTTTGSLLPNTAPAGLLATTTVSGLWGTTTGSLLPNTASAGLLATTTASGLLGTTTVSLLANAAPAGILATTASNPLATTADSLKATIVVTTATTTKPRTSDEKHKPSQQQNQQQKEKLPKASPSGKTESEVPKPGDTKLLGNHGDNRNQSKRLDGTMRDWKHRPPPRGLTNKEYTKCPRHDSEGGCRFGAQCSFAHSTEELEEWCARFELRKLELKRLREDGDSSSFSYAEKLTEKWMNADNPQSVMKEELEGVNVHLNTEQNINMSSKKCSHSWMITITTRVSVEHVILLDDANRKHFNIYSITVGPKKQQKTQSVPHNCQEWINPSFAKGKAQNEKVYRIKIIFGTEIYGTFRQSVVFDFGDEPVLVRHLCVDSAPVVDLHKLSEDLIISEGGRWDLSKTQIVQFESSCSGVSREQDEAELLLRYPPPIATKFTFSQTLLEPSLSTQNYSERMHSLLNLEEMAQFSSVAKFNVKTTLQLVDRFLLMPSSSYTTAKYAPKGELYARMKLNGDISEDTAHGRLILQNVNTVYMLPIPEGAPGELVKQPDKVYESFVEEKGKNFIFIRLSNDCVSENGLKMDTEFTAQVQFHLNRLPICQMHLGVDRLPNLDLMFPDIVSTTSIPWNPQKMWCEKRDSRLNPKQKEAIIAITTDINLKLPPILIIGPYGTGKTFTLAQATKDILTEDNTRVLICTHSNSAADLYIKDYLHPYVEGGHTEATPLRVYYRHRWVQTVHPVVRQYCLLGSDPGPHTPTSFRHPTLSDLAKVRVVVTTLSTSLYVHQSDMQQGFFTHILLDEAAQALECESILPLAMAGPNTRLVLAGDHMQLSPEIHSEFAQDRDFQKSLLERLYDMYPDEHPCKILLCENYRSHKAIIDFTSELFYDNKLVASGSQSRHDTFFPLSFFTARGEEVQHQNSTTFYNSAEVYETVERVSELINSWPEAWGERGEGSIGVVSPYSDQVTHIRAELRKRRLFNVSVERVLNVQGKQFRAILLSTVRTRHTCSTDTSLEDVMDYGFLSNAKLLNTAITRAQSLVAVVGDPVALCSVGKCRKIWERFVELCKDNSALCGMTWDHLWAQIDGVELKKTYILNPLAPEFIPNRLRHCAVAPPEPFAYGKYGYMFNVRPHGRGYQGTYAGAGPVWRPGAKGIMPPNGQNPMFQKARLMPKMPGIRFARMPAGVVPRHPSAMTVKIPGQGHGGLPSGVPVTSTVSVDVSPNTSSLSQLSESSKESNKGVHVSEGTTSAKSHIASPGKTFSPVPQVMSSSPGAVIGSPHLPMASQASVFIPRPPQSMVDMRQYGFQQPPLVRLGTYYAPQPVPVGPGMVAIPQPYPVMAPYQPVSSLPGLGPVVYRPVADGLGLPVHGPDAGIVGGPMARISGLRTGGTAESGSAGVPSVKSSSSSLLGIDSDTRPVVGTNRKHSLSPKRTGTRDESKAPMSTSGLESLIANKGSAFLQSLWLQQELYSYMVQTDGKEAANKFMQQMQAMATGSAPVISTQPYANSPGDLEDSSIIAVSRNNYKFGPPAPSTSSSMFRSDGPHSQYSRNGVRTHDQSYGPRSRKGYEQGGLLQQQTIREGTLGRGNQSVVPPSLPPFTGPYSLQKKLAAQNKSATTDRTLVTNGHATNSPSTDDTLAISDKLTFSSSDTRDELTDTHLVADSVVKFLEDTLDESLSSSQLTAHKDRSVPLYMRGQVSPQEGATSTTTATTTSTTTDSPRPLTYAGALRKTAPPTESPPILPVSAPSPQAPIHEPLATYTPSQNLGNTAFTGTQQLFPGNAGVRSSTSGCVGATSNPDPLELLRNLNIKASPSTQALFDYFA